MKNNMNLMALCLGVAVTAFAADATVPSSTNNQPLSVQIAGEARTAGKLAADLTEALSRKNADLTNVGESVATIEKSLTSIEGLIGQMDASRATMTAAQIVQLDRMKQVNDIMQVVFKNKKELASTTGEEARQQLRAHALMVKQRAELIEKSAKRIGS